jgi:hypothetical protein
MRLATGWLRLTGTFFCDRTTAQFLPLTPTEVMFAAVMALNAYSDVKIVVSYTKLFYHTRLFRHELKTAWQDVVDGLRVWTFHGEGRE